MNIKNIRSTGKFIANMKVRLTVFLFLASELIKRKLSFIHFVHGLRRLEYFLSKLQENKFVSIDKQIRLGLYIPNVGTQAFTTACKKFTVFREKLPNTTVLISITSACPFNCVHCYQKLDKGKDIAIETLVQTVKKIQDKGVAFFNIEGGEPFVVYDRLKALCEVIDSRSEIWVNSTGHGMNIEKLNELKSLGLTSVMFPLHTNIPEKMNSFMGSDKAWQTVIDGVELCHKVGIMVSFNMCLSRDAFFDGTFEACLEIAKERRAGIIQIIKPKNAGNWLNHGAPDFSGEDLAAIKEKVNLYNHDKKYHSYPSISAQILEEDPKMFGCTAGGTDRFYLNAKGDVQPCEFLNISFGNINDEPFDLIYKRMREAFHTAKNCWLCEKYSNKVASIVKDEKLESLPLSPEITEEFIKELDGGENTELYEVLHSMAPKKDR